MELCPAVVPCATTDGESGSSLKLELRVTTKKLIFKRFSAKINPVFELSAFDLYRLPSLAWIGDKKFSSFPRGDPREIEKFDPRKGAH